jgi:adenylate cyclase
VRPEWETPYGNRFDFTAVDAAEVREFLEKRRIRDRLLPIFETSFRRTTWRFDGVLLMLDRGWIAAGGRRQAISEVELELAGGAAPELFDLAEQLAARVPLVPAVQSKAERGYRLFLDIAPVPSRASQSPLSAGRFAELQPRDAFRLIATDCLDHLQRNHQGAATSEDPEYIHQMRVATRKLRAAMRLFAPVLTEGFVAELTAPLRTLMARLGAARDFDVLLHEVKAPVMQAFPDEPRLRELAKVVVARRDAARAAATDYLTSPAYGQLTLRIVSLLHRPPFAILPPPTDRSLLEFSSERLQRLRRKLRRLARVAELDNPASLHLLRIAVKRLRYALEFFAALPHGKERLRLAKHLTEAQGALGQLNDLVTAARLLQEAAGSSLSLREAAAIVGQWHVQQHHRSQEELAPLLSELRRLPPVR